MAMVHERLYHSSDLAHVDFGDYVRGLAAHVVQAYGCGEHVDVDVEMRGSRLTIDKAIPCGLIIHELLCNALKHAFPDRRPGRIWVRMHPAGGQRQRLEVGDDGVGLPEPQAPRGRATLGLDLVSTLAEQLHAEVHIDRNAGTDYRFTFPGGEP
jgi:two-component sensor histidine kinase